MIHVFNVFLLPQGGAEGQVEGHVLTEHCRKLVSFTLSGKAKGINLNTYLHHSSYACVIQSEVFLITSSCRHSSSWSEKGHVLQP